MDTVSVSRKGPRRKGHVDGKAKGVRRPDDFMRWDVGVVIGIFRFASAPAKAEHTSLTVNHLLIISLRNPQLSIKL